MATRAKKSGLLIVFEGGEGAGKSTQIRNLIGRLGEAGIHPVLTRQPGGTRLGEKIRELLLDPSWAPLNPRSELFLYLADRAQHVSELVLPALKQGKVVISDRFADSSTVYQGICRGLGKQWVTGLNRFATAELEPDLVFVLDIPESIRLKRLKKRGMALDRMEQEKSTFHRKVRGGFLGLARQHPRRIKIINGTLPEEKVAEAIWREVEKKLGLKT